MSNAGTYCHERALYPGSPLSLTQLFTPEVLQEPAVAAFALLNELWRVPEEVSEPSVGAAKLQWWQQQLAGDLQQANHPVITGLLNVHPEACLPMPSLVQLIDTLSECLELGVYTDEEALWQRCQRIGLSSLQVQLAVLGAEDDALMEATSNELWAAPLGLHYVLRLIHQFAHVDHCLPWPVPMNLQARHQVNPHNYSEKPQLLAQALSDTLGGIQQRLPKPAELAKQANLPQLLPCLLLYALEWRLLRRYQRQADLLLEQQQQRWRPRDTLSVWWHSQRLRKLTTALISQ